MSIWPNILQFLQTRNDFHETITQHYGTLESGNINFPFVVRHFLYDWIELRLANTAIPRDVSEDDHRVAAEAHTFFEELFVEIERKRIELNSSNQQSMAVNLMTSAKMFRRQYKSDDSNSTHYNPTSLYIYIRNSVELEKRMLGWSPELGESFVYDNELARTIIRISRVINEIKVTSSEHDSASQNLTLEHDQFNMVALGHIQANRSRFLESLSTTLSYLEMTMVEVINTHLVKWKEEQRLSGNGLRKKSAINIDLIRIWCQEFANIIWHVREKAKMLQSLEPAGQNSTYDQTLHEFLTRITNTLVYLITNTVIVEKQPPQVLKTNLKCSTQLEFLIGNKHIRMDAKQPGRVMIVSEAKALLIQQSNAVLANAACGDMENEIGVLVDNRDNRLLVGFPNSKLKKIKRTERKGAESVVEEKFALVFQSQFEFVSTKEDALRFNIWTLSLPIVVTVHGNQETLAGATIIWDNAFASNTRFPFEVPDSVTWSELIAALNMKFTSKTDRSLTQLNMRYLAEKLKISSDDQYVSWSMFCRNPLPNRTFTFWEWYYAAFKLTREHLGEIWSENYVMGFIQKDLAESYLMPCQEGTFLLRFSDSEIGGISIAWRTVDEFGNPCILHVQPLTGRDLASRSIGERLMDLEELAILYPNVPKAATFSRFVPKMTPAKTGYIPAPLRTVMP